MANCSLTGDSAFNAGEHNQTGSHNNTEYDYIYALRWYTYCYLLRFFTTLISIFGIFGNGMLIWLLGFCIKRNSFTTYILNLAIADFGFLTMAIIEKIDECEKSVSLVILVNLFYFVHFSIFSASQYLLTVISMDRCVLVFFPLWHRLHRPTYLSIIVSALIWALSFVPTTITFIIYINYNIFPQIIAYQFLVNAALCLPLMFISSLMLFIKICHKSKQQRQRKLLITILVTIILFLFLSFPFNFVRIIYFFFPWKFNYYNYVELCACLNSSVNPLIYYLVGRRKKGRSNRSIKASLQKLFKEEEI